MSLYRQAGGPGPRTVVIALLVGVGVGGLIGFLVGRGSVAEPSAAEVIADTRAALSPAAAGLELVPIEYEGALRGGEVESPTEYDAAKGAVARAEEALRSSREDLEAIDSPGYAAADQAIAQLEEAIAAVAPPTRVDALARRAAERIEALTGP